MTGDVREPQDRIAAIHLIYGIFLLYTDGIGS